MATPQQIWGARSRSIHAASFFKKFPLTSSEHERVADVPVHFLIRIPSARSQRLSNRPVREFCLYEIYLFYEMSFAWLLEIVGMLNKNQFFIIYLSFVISSKK